MKILILISALLALGSACLQAENRPESRLGQVQADSLPDALAKDYPSPPTTTQALPSNQDNKQFQLNSNGPVTAIAQSPTGQLYLAGDFRSDNGSRFRIVRTQQDGSLDEEFTLAQADAFDGPVTAIAVDQNGNIFVGGRFAFYHDLEVVGLVKLNRDGEVDQLWTSLGTKGIVGSIISLALLDEDTLVASGQFIVGSEAVNQGILIFDSNIGSSIEAFPELESSTESPSTESVGTENAAASPTTTTTLALPSHQQHTKEAPIDAEAKAPTTTVTSPIVVLEITNESSDDSNDIFSSQTTIDITGNDTTTTTSLPAASTLIETNTVGTSTTVFEAEIRDELVIETEIILENIGSLDLSEWEKMSPEEQAEEDIRLDEALKAADETPKFVPQRKEECKAKIKAYRTKETTLNLKLKDLKDRQTIYPPGQGMRERIAEAREQLKSRREDVAFRLKEIRTWFVDYKTAVKELRNKRQKATKRDDR